MAKGKNSAGYRANRKASDRRQSATASAQSTLDAAESGRRAIDREDYARLYAIATGRDEPDTSFISPTLGRQSGVGQRRTVRAYRQQRDAHNRAVEEGRTRYDTLVSEGRIISPSRIQRLTERASGHPDNATTQASRRILDRLGVRYSTPQG